MLPVIAYKRPPKSSSKIAAVLKQSDWHIGASISAEETEGFGAFNWDTAQHRVRYITDKFLANIHANRKIHDIRDLFVFGEGDWVSGDIHAELRSTTKEENRTREREQTLPGRIPRVGSSVMHTLGLQFAKLYAPNAIENQSSNFHSLCGNASFSTDWS